MSHVRPNIVSFCRWLIAFALAGFQIAAHSSNLYTVNNFSTFTALTLSVDSWRIAPTNSAPSTHISTPYTGSIPLSGGRMGVISNSSGVSVGSNFKFPLGPGSNTGVVDVVAKVPRASLAKALTNFAKKVSPIGTATAIYDLFKEINVSIKHGESENTFYRKEINSGYLCRVGDKTSLTCVDAFNQYWTPYLKEINTISYIEDLRCPSSPSDGNLCTFVAVSDFTWVNPGDWRRNDRQQPVTWVTSETPDETPVTREEVERLLGTPESWPPSSAIPRALGEALGSGETVQVETPKVTVPPSQPGLLPTSETVKQTSQETYTRPDGSTGTREIVKTVTTTRNPSLSSNQDVVKLNNRVTTTTTTQATNDDGTVTNSPPVTTTTESTNTTDYPQDYTSTGNGGGSSPDSGSNICEVNPNALACQELGEPPNAEKLPNVQKSLEIVEKAFSSNASCPAPIDLSVSISGITIPIVLSYQPVCDFLGYINYVVLALAGLLSVHILSDSFRVS